MSKQIISPEVRFWSRVNKNGPTIEKMESCCWEYIPPRGYKQRRGIDFNFGSLKYGYKCMNVGRASFIFTYGKDIPRGMSVIRRCANYRCVRPEHLVVGSRNETLSVDIIELNGNRWRRCTKCKNLLLVDKSNFNVGGWNGNLSPECKKCSVKRSKESGAKNWARLALYRAEDSSKTKNLDFDLSKEFILELFSRQGGLCYWLGIPMQPSPIHRYPFHPSLDRLDRNKGYVKDNVVLCCQFMNVGRNSCSQEAFISALSMYPDIFGKGLWNSNEK